MRLKAAEVTEKQGAPPDQPGGLRWCADNHGRGACMKLDGIGTHSIEDIERDTGDKEHGDKFTWRDVSLREPWAHRLRIVPRRGPKDPFRRHEWNLETGYSIDYFRTPEGCDWRRYETIVKEDIRGTKELLHADYRAMVTTVKIETWTSYTEKAWSKQPEWDNGSWLHAAHAATAHQGQGAGRDDLTSHSL